MTIYQPYTYLIGWSGFNKWYYGCQYSNSKQRGIAHPSNLWNTYFTSSRYVEDFREQYGDPDIIEVRKVFNEAQKAIRWEQRVLSKLNLAKRSEWLNKHNGGEKFYVDEIVAYKISNSLKGKILTDETKEKLRRANLGKKQSLETIEKRITKIKGRKKLPHTKEAKLKISKSLRGKMHTEEHKEKIRLKMIGRKFSEETKEKMRKPKPKGFSEKLRLANLGKIISDESKEKNRLAHSGKKRQYKEDGSYYYAR